MLTKAILTGGALSVLAFSIVYFGTEGAGALESEVRETIRAEETDLAGAADVAVGDTKAELNVEDLDPPKETSKPKTKWLDQYLKKTKPESKPQIKAEELDEVENQVEEDLTKAPMNEIRKRLEIRTDRNGGSDSAQGAYVVTEGSRLETFDIEGLDVDVLDGGDEVDIQALIEELGLDSEENIQVRVVKKKIGAPSLRGLDIKNLRNVDYSVVIAEAEKLLVTDMRNQAYLEIVDHAVDEGDMMQAADIVDELSTPELRDTARARIGTGLARRGETKAAFAVLDELEIDELSAPIRLEIITALMATKQERKNFASQ